jgi:hypothetical protein
VTARTLARRIAMRTSEREVFEAIRFLECTPEIGAVPTAESVLTIEPFRGRHRISEEGKDNEEVLGVRSVVDHLHSRLFSYSLGERPRAGVVHAALLRRGSRRVLIAGSQGTGKTTLALHLIRAGYELEGDEHVFLDDDGVVIARPRACQVRETSLALLPEVAEVILSAPAYVEDSGCTIFNVDPRLIGGSWRIEKGNVDCVIVLQPNHGGYSSLRHLPPMMVAQALISEMGMREIDRGVSIGAIAALVSRCKGYDLSLGDPEGAVKCVDRALDG